MSKDDRLHSCPKCGRSFGDHYLVHKDELHKWKKVISMIQEELQILTGGVEVVNDKG